MRALRALIGLSLLLPLLASGAVSYDAASPGSTTADASSLTFPHTVSSGCANPGLVVVANVDIALASGDVVTGVTYNGDGMARTLYNHLSGTNNALYVYELPNPDKGGSFNVVISMSVANGITAGAISVCGAHQTSLVRAGGTAQTEGTGTTWTAPTIATSTTDLAIGGFSMNSEATSGTCDSPATERVDRQSTHNSVALLLCTATPSGSTIGMTGTNSVSDNGQTFVVSAQEAEAAVSRRRFSIMHY